MVTDKKKLTLIFLLVAIAALCSVAFAAKAPAFAEESMTAYKLQGTVEYDVYANKETTTGVENAEFFKDNFVVELYSGRSSDDGSSYVAQDKFFNTSYITITATIFSGNPHVNYFSFAHGSYSLKDNNTGEVISRKYLSGKNEVGLFSGNLEDGSYTLTYNIYGESVFAADMSGSTDTFTYRFNIDTEKPTIQLTSNGQSISSGATTNEDILIRVSETHFKELWIKSPADTNYRAITSASYEVENVVNNNGIWYFYATDQADNRSETISALLDVISPVCAIYNEDTPVSDGAVVNAKFIKYLADDLDSGLKNCFVKKPEQQDYISYMSGTPFTVQGTYTFYAIDKAQNQSSYLTITLDNTQPIGMIYDEERSTANNSFVNNSHVKFNANDAISYIASAYVLKPGASSYTDYTLNSPLTTEGTYNFYAVDATGLRSDTYTITLDRTKPSTTLSGDGKALSSGAVTNAEKILFTATDSLSGIQAMYVKKPTASAFSNYTSETVLNEDGNYQFYAVDRSGNQSDISLMLWDRLTPDGLLYAGPIEVENGTVTNADYIKFFAVDDMSGIANCYVLMPGEKAFSIYNEGTQLSVEGEYHFYAEDNAKNRSPEYIITIDRTRPTGLIYGDEKVIENGGFTNAAYISYAPSDNRAIRTIYAKIPGATDFAAFDIETKFSAEGKYEFYCDDFANNVSAILSVTLDKTNPVNTLYVGAKIVGSGAKTNAKYIKLSATDALSGVAKIYVKAPGSQTYSEYVTGTELTVEGCYEFYSVDKANNRTDTVSVILDRTAPIGTLYAGTATIENGGYTIASYIKFAAVDDLSDVTAIFVKMPGDENFIPYTVGTILSAEGVYVFYAIDGSNNRSNDYIVTIDRIKPTGTLYAGTKSVNSETITNAEYVTFVGRDNVALGNHFVKKPGDAAFVTFVEGEQFKQEGDYQFYVEDRAGNRSETVTIKLDKTKPTGHLNIIGGYTNKPIAYTATDERSGIAKCEYRIDDDGWKDYISGTVIPVTAQNGLYTFRAYDTANNVSDELSIYFDTIKPIGKLFAESSEVADGSYTNAPNIHFTATDATLDALFILTPGAKEFVIYKNGALYAEAGKYEFYAVDLSQNRSETYTVTIDRIAPFGQIYGDDVKIENGFFMNAPYVKFIVTDESGISGVFVKTPGSVNFVPYAEGTMLSTEGEYVFYAIDLADNRSNDYAVTIDRTPPTGTLFAGDQTAASGTITNADYVTFTGMDNFALDGLFVKKPGANSFERFTAGTRFTLEGTYSFYGEDRARNRTAIVTITLDTSKPTGQIFADATTIGNGAYTNAQTVSFTASDTVSGEKRILVKLPSQPDFVVYESGRKISETGLIQFRIEDNASNVSELYTVILDTENPSGQIHSVSGSIPSGAILNVNYIVFTATDGVSGVATVYVKLPNANNNYGGRSLSGDAYRQSKQRFRFLRQYRNNHFPYLQAVCCS